MGLFDAVFDELGKEIKEAPGWLLLVIVCNLLLFLPAISREMKILEVEKEETTIATLVAMGLFFLGDVLDTLVFPRERDRKRGEKFLAGSMLLLGAFAVFLFLMGAVWWAAGLSAAWIITIPIYDSRKRIIWSVAQRWIAAIRGPRKTPAAPKEPREDETGFKRLVPQYNQLMTSRNDVSGKLGIDRGIYRVSKALARKAARYTMPIWLPNELAKFIRSAVFPAFAAGVWILVDQRHWSGVALILASPALLSLYCWLKAHHMRKLYDLAGELVKENKPNRYSSPAPCHGVRLFLWGADVVDCVSLSAPVE